MKKFRFALILVTMSTVLLIAVVAASIGYARQSLTESTYQDLEAQSARASNALTAQVENRFQLYQAQAEVTSAEPRIRAVVGTDGINAATVVGVARDIQEGLGADIFLLTDGEGYLLGDTADPEAQGFDLSGMPLVAGAIKDGKAVGTWSVEGVPHQVVSQAIMVGQGLTGVLVIGYAFEQPFFDALHGQTGVSVGLRSDDKVLSTSAAPADVDAANAAGFWSSVVTGDTSKIPFGSAEYTRSAVPLQGYSGDGTIEFVLTQSVDLALASARALQERLTLIAGIFVAFGALIFAVFSRILGRSLKRLVDFTQKLGRGELGGSVQVGGPRELAVLGDAMNKMSVDLESAQQQIIAAKAEVDALNASLENKVRERTRELRVVNREVQEILDNLTDGVFIIDDQLNLVGRTSPACKEVLGMDNLLGRSVKDFLFVGDASTNESLALALSSLTFAFGMDADMFELNLPHLPTTWEYDHPGYAEGSEDRSRVLNLSYCPLEDADGEVTRILVVASDLTTLLKLERENKAKDEVLRKRTTAMSDILGGKRSELPEFMSSFARLFSSARDRLKLAGEGDHEARAVVLRDLHTIKGNARATRLGVLSSEVHGIESAVIAAFKAEGSGLSEAFEPLVVIAETYLNLFEEFFAAGNEKGPSTGNMSNRVLRRLSALQHASSVGDAIRDLQRAWQAETLGEVYPLAERFVERHTPMLEEVAQRLSKQVEFLPLVGDDFLALGVVSNVLDQYAGHLVRNAIDHGLESPEERRAAGKTAVGHVWLEVALPEEGSSDDRVELVFCDDGRGIDLVKVRRLVGCERGIRPMRGLAARPRASETLKCIILILLFLHNCSVKRNNSCASTPFMQTAAR